MNNTFNLIQTKLNKPKVTNNLVLRSHLIETLNEGLKSKLTLISAPAGYGKTTLAVAWLEQIAYQSAWLSLDENDNDLLHFFNYLLATIHKIIPHSFDEVNALFKTTQKPPIDYLVSLFLNAIDDLTEPFVLVLDDYHTIQDREIEAFMDRLITYLPSHISIVLCCRFDPHLPLARLRVQRQLNEVRVDELCFSIDETHLLLEQTSGQEVEPEVANLLAERMEGWVTGLYLAALTLQTQQNPKTYITQITENTNIMLLDYLVEEVLAKQAPATQEFLFQTSILDRFCASLCDAVLENKEGVVQETDSPSQAILNELEHSGFFVIRLDNRQGWYRYHHLFRDLLRRQFNGRIPQLNQAHRRASTWFASNDYRQEALHHALAGKDTATAIKLIEQYRIPAMNQARWHELKRWLQQLPDEVIHTRPALAIAWAVVLNTTKINHPSLPILQQAEQCLSNDDALSIEERIQLQAEINALLASSPFYTGQYQQTLKLTQQALQHLPATHSYLRGLALAFQCVTLQALGQKEKGINILTSTISNFDEPAPIRIQAFVSLCFIYLASGNLLSLQQTANHMCRFGKSTDSPLAIAWANYFLGIAHYEWNELEDTAVFFEIVYQNRYMVSFLIVQMAMVGLCKTHLANNNFAQAQQTLDKFQTFSTESGNNNPSPVIDTLQSLILWQQGELGNAERWAQNVFASPRPTPLFFYEHNELTQLLVTLNQNDHINYLEITSRLEELLAEARLGHGTLRTIQLLSYLAVTYQKQGLLDNAHTHLAQALVLAMPGRFIRTFVDLGQPMAQLLKNALTKLPENNPDQSIFEYATHILEAFPSNHAALDPYSIAWQQAQASMQDPLTPRESQVLVLLAQGQSYQEIANQLIVTLNTVKKHTSHIYQKLEVNNRKDAIKKAHALNILTPV